MSLKEVKAAVFWIFHICFSLGELQVCFPFVYRFLSVCELPYITLSCLFYKEHYYCRSNDVMMLSILPSPDLTASPLVCT